MNIRLSKSNFKEDMARGIAEEKSADLARAALSYKKRSITQQAQGSAPRRSSLWRVGSCALKMPATSSGARLTKNSTSYIK